MSLLVPTLIRNAICEALKAANIAGVGNHVYSGRTIKGFPHEGPYISIYANDTNFDNDSSYDGRIYSAVTDVSVDIVVQGDMVQIMRGIASRTVIDVETQMDTIADKVLKTLLYAGMDDKRNLQINTENTLFLTRCERILDGDGEKNKGVYSMSFDVRWSMQVPFEPCENACNEIDNRLNVPEGDSQKDIQWLIPLAAL